MFSYSVWCLRCSRAWKRILLNRAIASTMDLTPCNVCAARSNIGLLRAATGRRLFHSYLVLFLQDALPENVLSNDLAAELAYMREGARAAQASSLKWVSLPPHGRCNRE
jgi:hypothetical protein